MKVSCQSCGANYNLPDDKVRGKKAKVRCKKCGESIVVDGTQGVSPSTSSLFDEEDEATRVMEMPTPGSTSSDHWTVNLSDEDQRDMSTAEVVAGWVSKLVTEDAYVWRDGMDEWLPILSSELLPLIRAAEAGGASSAPIDETLPTATGSDTSATKPVPVAPKSSPIATSAAASAKVKPLGGGKRPSVTAGLFGPLPDKNAKTSPAKQPVRPAAPAATAAAGGPKTAENSVMFSLDALKAAAAADNSVAEPDTRIPEDLLTLGTPGGFDVNPLPLIQIDAPAPVQAAALPQVSLSNAAPAKSSSLNTLVIGVIGLGLIAAVFFGVRSALTPAAPAAALATQEETRKPAAAGEEPAQAAQPAAEVAAAASAASPVPEAKPTTAAAPASPAQAAAPAHAAATPAAKPVGGATPAKPKSETAAAEKPKPQKESGGGGGAAFDVGAAKDALGTASSQAKLCKTGDGPTGSGKVQVTFAPSGRVTSANVQGPPFAGTSVGGCVARAFRSARIPSFDGSPQTVSKGFTIN